MENNLFYTFVSRCIIFPLFKCFFRGKVHGYFNIPRKGSLIVVSNHGSHLDPPLLGHALGRPIGFMAKAELFKIPIMGYLIRQLGAYPVKRGGSDREAIRMASERLSEGLATGIFLDGTRQSNGRVNHPMNGAAFLSARTNSSLLPVAIINSHRALRSGSFLPRFVPIHIYIGEPLSPPNSKKKLDLDLRTTQLQNSINNMIDNFNREN